MIDQGDVRQPAHELYQQIYKELKINPRTIQWYATEGYIPKPEKIGAEAFYSESVQLLTRVRVIQMLQKRYELKLKEIRQIVEKQAKSDWECVYNLLVALEEQFPLNATDDYGFEYITDKGSALAKNVCEQLKKHTVENIHLEDEEAVYDEARSSHTEEFLL